MSAVRTDVSLLCALVVAACGDNKIVVDPCLLIRCIGEDCLAGDVVATGEARRVAAGVTRLYWFDRAGTLFEAPIAGGEPVQVVETDTFIGSVRSAGDTVVWANNFGADTYHPNTGVRRLTDDAITFGFAMDDAAIYYGILNNVLVRLTIADLEPTAWAATQATALGVTLAGDDLFYTNCESVFRARNEMLSPQEAIARGGCPIEIAAGATTVAWTEQAPPDGNNTIRAYDLGTGEVRDLVTTLPDESVLHVDDTHVYYGSPGSACRIPVGGGVPTKIVNGSAFAFDATHVYWGFPDGTMRRAPKPPD
jgi:hypothetical protein